MCSHTMTILDTMDPLSPSTAHNIIVSAQRHLRTVVITTWHRQLRHYLVQKQLDELTRLRLVTYRYEPDGLTKRYEITWRGSGKLQQAKAQRARENRVLQAVPV